MRHVSLTTLLLLCAVSCSAVPRAAGAASPFDGTWVQREPVAGTSFVFTVTVTGRTVAGTGTYTIEGGRSGQFDLAGGLDGERLRLAFTYDGQAQAQFDGELTSPAVLHGGLHLGPRQALTPAAMVSFDRRP